jgi:hypothetical protein
MFDGVVARDKSIKKKSTEIAPRVSIILIVCSNRFPPIQRFPHKTTNGYIGSTLIRNMKFIESLFNKVKPSNGIGRSGCTTKDSWFGTVKFSAIVEKRTVPSGVVLHINICNHVRNTRCLRDTTVTLSLHTHGRVYMVMPGHFNRCTMSIRRNGLGQRCQKSIRKILEYTPH